MNLWGSFCFLSAFAATGECLRCITCSEVFSDSCSIATIENCPDGHVCASQYKVSITGGYIFQHFERSCAPQSECNVTGTFTHYSTKEKIATTCCSNDLCTPAKPKVPSTNSEPNGVMCPRCKFPSDFCDQNMECTGNQTMCLLVSTTNTVGDQTEQVITRGCASSGYCIKNSMTSKAGEVYTETTYKCTNGTRSEDISSSTLAATIVARQPENTGTSHRGFSLSAVISLSILLILM